MALFDVSVVSELEPMDDWLLDCEPDSVMVLSAVLSVVFSVVFSVVLSVVFSVVLSSLGEAVVEEDDSVVISD